MIKIEETIVVEGIYDKIKISSFVDALIFVTGGFSIIRDKEKTKALKTICDKTGVIIMTDSDSAGFMIRNYLKEQLPKDKVKHAYIPDKYGKERRKKVMGKEGLLGVEGMDSDIIIKSLIDSGATIDGNTEQISKNGDINKTDLYRLGLSGRENSAELRKKLLLSLSLPTKISSNMLCNVLNKIMCYNELEEMICIIKSDISVSKL